MGSSVTTRHKSWEKVPILGSYLKFSWQNLGYLSFIFLEAKFEAPTRISEANFEAKPHQSLNMEVPPLGTHYYRKRCFHLKLTNCQPLTTYSMASHVTYCILATSIKTYHLAILFTLSQRMFSIKSW